MPPEPPADRRPVVEQDGDFVVISIPMTFRKRNGRKQIVLPPDVRDESPADADARCALRVALARAYRWQKMIESGEIQSAGELARRLKLDRSYIARTMRLTALAPDIVEAVIRGDEPDGLSLRSIRFDVPLAWQEQRRVLGVSADDRRTSSPHPARPAPAGRPANSVATPPLELPSPS